MVTVEFTSYLQIICVWIPWLDICTVRLKMNTLSYLQIEYGVFSFKNKVSIELTGVNNHPLCTVSWMAVETNVYIV